MLTYKEDWLKAQDLKPGHVYLTKNEQLVLYLGQCQRNRHNEYVFYIMAATWLVKEHAHVAGDQYERITTYGNYDVQIEGLKRTVRLTMQQAGDIRGLIWYNRIPKIYGDFSFQEYESEYLAWRRMSFPGIFTDDLPE